MKTQKLISFCLTVLLLVAMPTYALGATVDMGHGSGCGHVHSSGCYTSYNAGDRLCDYCGKPLWCSGKTTVTKSMLYDHAYYDHICITSLQNTRLTHGGTYTGMASCPGSHCGFWDLLYDNTTTTGWYRTWYCGNDVRGIEVCGPSGFVDYDGQCTTAAEAGSALTCTTPNDPTFSKCIKPSIYYAMPTQWTNQSVTINYTGTVFGSLSFDANGTKSVSATSSTGHRIREDITVDKIDVDTPMIPNFKLDGEGENE